MFSPHKIEDYKQFQLWAVRSDDSDACYIRIKDKDDTGDNFKILLKTVDCSFVEGDHAARQKALVEVKKYIDNNLMTDR
ncbi:hypothetical protein D3H65_06985 [Paraflavitalea soli]|uniref:Uncharacterized protein n=1 Tax=Paraflavitalea soli TaxID=2315862 RepID=A0A3B7ML48_9BACT|nr:hypothetical protein [Paraflavitalea soli]AXY73736.1 hypothetical protein D3H65_06985 [Paraflavitalea soli]